MKKTKNLAKKKKKNTIIHETINNPEKDQIIHRKNTIIKETNNNLSNKHYCIQKTNNP